MATAERALTRTFGVEFRDHEIAGIDRAVRELFSVRRQEIVAGTRELAAEYAERYQREPDRSTRNSIAQHVTLATRPPKPRNQPKRSVQLSRWDQRMTDRLRTNLAEVLRDVETESARLKEPTVTDDSARERLVAAVDSFRDRAADRLARAAVEIQRAEKHDRFQLWRRDDWLYVIGLDRNHLPWVVCGPVEDVVQARFEPWDRRTVLERTVQTMDLFTVVRDVQPHELSMGATSWDQLRLEENAGQWRIVPHEPRPADRLAEVVDGFRARAAAKLEQMMPERVAEQAITAAYAEAEIKRRIEQARQQAMRPSGP